MKYYQKMATVFVVGLSLTMVAMSGCSTPREDRMMLKDNIKYFSKNGACFAYVGKPGYDLFSFTNISCDDMPAGEE